MTDGVTADATVKVLKGIVCVCEAVAHCGAEGVAARYVGVSFAQRSVVVLLVVVQ